MNVDRRSVLGTLVLAGLSLLDSGVTTGNGDSTGRPADRYRIQVELGTATATLEAEEIEAGAEYDLDGLLDLTVTVTEVEP